MITKHGLFFIAGTVVFCSLAEGFVSFAPASMRTSLQGFNGYHEPPQWPTNQEADEERQKKIAAERKVRALESQLQFKESEYRRALNNLNEETKKMELVLKEKMDDLATSLQSSKFDSHKKLMEMKQAYEQKESLLRKQLDTVRNERDELKAQFEEMKKQYTADSLEWEDRLEMEQNERLKQEKESTNEVIRLQEEARKLVQRAKVDATVKLSKKEKELTEKDYQLKETKLNLGSKDMKLKELEEERDSIRKLARRSWALTKDRVKGKLQGLKSMVTKKNGVMKNGMMKNGVKNGSKAPSEKSKTDWNKLP